MAGVGLLALLDDIATLLDDVSMMTKVAAKKTASVLGDDLALNAEQVSGVNASRELPIVWAVAKGSFVNKLILVPLAIAISAFVPEAVRWLLMMGGLYLCYEGTEKIAEQWLHPSDKEEKQKQLRRIASDQSANIEEYEKAKIKGAIRTDFILSAEIIVIALGTVQGVSVLEQALVVGLIAILITAGVYAVVAAIVRFDDMGLALIRAAKPGWLGSLQKRLGRFILMLAPKLMHFLGWAGMIAMFLVGGSLLVHGVPAAYHFTRDVTATMNDFLTQAVPLLIYGSVGIVAGMLVLMVITLLARIKKGTE